MLITLLISYSRVGHHDIKAKYYLIPGIKLSEDQSWIIRLSSENYWKLILTETWIIHWRYHKEHLSQAASMLQKLPTSRQVHLPDKYIQAIKRDLHGIKRHRFDNDSLWHVSFKCIREIKIVNKIFGTSQMAAKRNRKWLDTFTE